MYRVFSRCTLLIMLSFTLFSCGTTVSGPNGDQGRIEVAEKSSAPRKMTVRLMVSVKAEKVSQLQGYLGEHKLRILRTYKSMPNIMLLDAENAISKYDSVEQLIKALMASGMFEYVEKGQSVSIY